MTNDELKRFGLTESDLESIKETGELDEGELEELQALSPAFEDDLNEGGEGEPNPLGKAAVAATLAATLLVPSAALATEVVLDEPAAIIQTIDMNAPDDNPPAVDDAVNDSKSQHNIRKLLFKVLAGLLSLLLALLVACVAGAFNSLGPLGCGGSSPAAGDGQQVTLLLETDEGYTATSDALIDIRDLEGTVLLDDEDVVVNRKEELLYLEPGEYQLVFEQFPEASNGTVFRPDTEVTTFQVEDGETDLVVHLLNAG